MVFWATGKETLDAFTGLGRRNPLVAIGMTICLVSLVGLPPLGGFTAKIWLLYNVWGAGLQWLVVVAVLNTALSLYFYAKVLRQMWQADDGQPVMAAPFGGLVLVGISALVILWTGTVAIGSLRSRADDFSKQLYLGSAAPTVPVAEIRPTGRLPLPTGMRRPQAHADSPTAAPATNPRK
jgi:NADH:ubiquinone oxidoreductase subunit 2 (subunit N)